MSTHDTNGREWAKVSEVKEGSIVVPDSDFCGSLAHTNEYTVRKDEHGLFLEAVAGKHYLDGQIDHEEGTHYVGLYLKA